MIDLNLISNKKGIYKFTNIKNGKIYFGETIDSIKGRILDHKTSKNKDYFHHAIRDNGWDSFEIEILHEFDEITKDELWWIEANYIECFETYKRENGYNTTRYGCGNFGTPCKEETKRKISQAQLGEKNHMFGKHLSEEARKRISIASKNRIISQETREKLRLINLGKKHTPETIEKMRVIGKNRIFSEETKQKIKEARKHQNMFYREKPVKQINKNTNEIIKIWKSASDAARNLGFKYNHIGRVCNKDPIYKSSNGFRWEYF